MPKTVYAVWLGDSWLTSCCVHCLQSKYGRCPDSTWKTPDEALAEYQKAVNCGQVAHSERNAIVAVKFERV